jgi:glycerophosphoryl diester phosphodiesterase
MVRVAAHRGNRLHAPENTRTALLSAYTAGADVLEFDVQLTKDGFLVVSHDGTTDRLTGQAGRILDMTLSEILALDVSKTFKPRGATAFQYCHGKRRVRMETFPELLDVLPRTMMLLVELKHDSSLASGRRDEFVGKALDALSARALLDNVVLYSKDPDNLRVARRLAPRARLAAFDWELTPERQVQLMVDLDADGLVAMLSQVADEGGALTEMGRELKRLHAERKLRVGAALYPYAEGQPGVFSAKVFQALSQHDFVWSVSTDSMLDVAPFTRRSWTWLQEPFAGRRVRTDRWSLGYAKANKYCHVFQEDGVHVAIDAYPPIGPQTQTDDLERRVAELEEQITFALKDWPYYSGGGVGLVPGLSSDFAAEVDYTAQHMSQATTLEMAAVNVDPGAHQEPWNPDGTPRRPRSIRDKTAFFDPHGAPPYVGVEHDEDDGYRINWNLGSEYDDNRYGQPVGDGAAPRAGRLRLERRGPYFAAYYRNEVDAPTWVCVGAVRNDSLNRRVFLRCAGKRWRQERSSEEGGGYYPIVANEFVFRNLEITRFDDSEKERG